MGEPQEQEGFVLEIPKISDKPLKTNPLSW